MSAPIVITVPTKYIPINLAPLAIKTESSSSHSCSLSDADESSMDEFLVRGKKRRLDHLTWEEKLQRKKLKNRVAAQTSRDRKKAKMEEMEQTIQQQTDQISELQLKCASLQAEKDTYYSKCLDLENRQAELERRLNDLQQHLQLNAIKSETTTPAASHSVGSASTLLGSAASAQTPQQQGSLMEAQTTLSQDKMGLKTDEEKVATLWKIVALCLLYRTCSKTSTCPSSKSSPKAFWPMSQANWKELIREASRLMPKAQAPAAECLDQWWGPHQNSWNPAKKLIKEAA
ncbi:AAEL005558-PA [Aedes aegypti]|uniref:X-box-binding protein 1 n=1 Tax=Aedes aegypti TaxID=7159 RepID=Q179N5_AEDAE|nr:AAEL005558-PA [Aedes aegypti]